MPDKQPTPIRASIWLALSTVAQVTGDDKTSLEVQEEECRKIIVQKGWKEINTYSLIGSRIRFVDLSAAEREYPMLKMMLDDAEKGRYDVLVMYDYDRLRDLIDPVANVLEQYGIQVYSVNQPTEITPPELFSRYSNESGLLTRTVMLMAQRLKTNQLRRDYTTKMPKRVLERGLPATHVPYGYTKSGAESVPVKDNELLQHVLTMRDLLFEGHSLAAIADVLNDMEVPSPRGESGGRKQSGTFSAIHSTRGRLYGASQNTSVTPGRAR